MKKLFVMGIACLLLISLGSGCAVENRVIAKKTWDAAPDEVSIVGEINTDNAFAKEFKGYTDGWLEKLIKGYKYSVVSGADLTLTYTVDVLEPGNRWLRWVGGIFGAGQGYVQGKVTVKQKSKVLGEYEYAVVQRGGFLGGTLNDMGREAAYGIASKINNKKFDEKLYDRKK